MEKELFNYFMVKAREYFGMTFAGLCEECSEEQFKEWCLKNKGFYSYELYLLAKWVWNYFTFV